LFYPTLDPVAPDRATGTSVTRALRVIEAVAAAGDGVTAKMIARRVGIPLPSVYRAIGTLVEEGYLVRLQEVRGYGLGHRVAQLHRSLAEQMRPPPLVREVLHDLHVTLGGAAYLALLRDLEIVVAHVDDCAEHPRPAPLLVGETLAVHATAAGKAVLAELPRGQLAEFTARSPLLHSVDDAELGRIRADGTAVTPAEHRPDTAGVAAAVHGSDGTVRGALGVTVPRSEVTARRSELARVVREAAAFVDHDGQLSNPASSSSARSASSAPASGTA
jgi:DNA-binding IclR family transcriptional regulator